MTSLVVGTLVGNEILTNSVRRSTTTLYESILDILGSNADQKFKNTIEENSPIQEIKLFSNIGTKIRAIKTKENKIP